MKPLTPDDFLKNAQAAAPKMDSSLSAVNIEQLKMDLDAFVDKILARFKYDRENTVNTPAKMHVIPPKDIDFENLYLNSFDYTDHLGPTPPLSILKACEYTVNPETLGIDWAKVSLDKIKVLQFPGFFREANRSSDLDRKGRHKLIEYIMKTSPDREKYYFPGFEYEKYLIDNPEQIPPALRSIGLGSFYFIGSILQNAENVLRIPGATNTSKGLNKYTAPLFVDFDRSDYIVAVEK